MIIYGNNLHEKLQGVALSRDYLKYHTPFCDMVDDPVWEVDINLALDYQSAISGNLAAANSLVESLTLNSSVLDGSTVEYYITKIKNNPSFDSAIKRINSRWNNPSAWSDSFQSLFNRALKDCLNSPCNLFLETSDSIGRIAQAASTKTSSNTFGVGALSASFINMIEGLDQTLRNSIPNVFADAWTEITQVADKAFTNTQKVLAGKENLSVFSNLIDAGQTLRSPEKVFRYTPDVKSYYDYSAAGSNNLSKIKEVMGGCFSRFEYNYRYNPYEDNLSQPIGHKVQQVNGRTYDTDATGNINRAPNNELNLERHTRVGPETNVPLLANNDVKISQSYNIYETGKSQDDYTIFAAYVDKDSKTLWYDPYAAKQGDIWTRQGKTSLAGNVRIGISVEGPSKDFIANVLNGETVTERELRLYNETQVGAYALGYKHIISNVGMETLYQTADPGSDGFKINNDGVAISHGLIKAFLNDPNASLTDASWLGPARANELFAAVKPVNKNFWTFYKVVDSNSQTNLNVDFTVGAYKHLLETYAPGKKLDASKNFEIIAGTNPPWKRVAKNYLTSTIGTLEVRICLGNIAEIKASKAFSGGVQSINQPQVTPGSNTNTTTPQQAANPATFPKSQPIPPRDQQFDPDAPL